MKLNGWQRLWVLAGLLYGIGIIIYSLQNASYTHYTQEGIEERWAKEASQIMNVKTAHKRDGFMFRDDEVREKMFVNMTDHEVIDFLKMIAESPSKWDKSYSNDIPKLNKKFEAEIKALPLLYTRHTIVTILLWIVPSFIVYLFGWLVAWVIRGFKKE